MKAAARDLALAASLLSVCAYVWYETASYPVPAGDAMVEGLGPAFYPRLLAVTLAGFAVLVVATTLWPRPPAAAVAAPAAAPADWRRAALLLAFLIGYRLLIPAFGYRLATSLALVALMAFLAGPERRRRPLAWGIIAASATVATAGVHLLFTRVVRVPLPVGSLFGG